jgi:hypothetical protein
MSPRFVALAVVAAGATGSIVLMLRVGSRQQSILLIALFAGWVLLPFAALGWAGIASKAWSSRARAAYYGASLFVTLASVAMYAGLIPMPSGSPPAAVFLVVPTLSWILFAMVAGTFRLRSGH